MSPRVCPHKWKASADRARIEPRSRKHRIDAASTTLSAALQQCQQRHFKSLAGECGLGWQISETIEGLRIHWHNGGTAGYYSFAAFDAQHKTAVVLLSNYGDAFANDHSIDKMGMEILRLASKVSLERE